MARPVTLFTGQWADLPLETLAAKARELGFDGLELACWGDHFEVDRALAEDGYVQGRKDLLAKYDLEVHAISNHLVGQAVCDRIDERHKSILPPRIWGDGNGVQERAAEEMKNTARAAAKLGVKVVPGFTGSSIWPLLYSFPPVPDAWIDAGFRDFPIIMAMVTEMAQHSEECRPGLYERYLELVIDGLRARPDNGTLGTAPTETDVRAVMREYFAPRHKKSKG